MFLIAIFLSAFCQVQLGHILDREGGWDAVQVITYHFKPPKIVCKISCLGNIY